MNIYNNCNFQFLEFYHQGFDINSQNSVRPNELNFYISIIKYKYKQ